MFEHLKTWFSLYIVLLVLTFPFPYDLLYLFNDLVVTLVGPFCFKTAQILGLDPLLMDLSSDSKSLVVLLLLQLTVSVALVGISPFRKWLIRVNIIRMSRSIAAFFLALILFKYGFDKLFKQQFYLPEPNLLFTPLGHLDKDILYWSTMGVSRSYNIFLGLAEVIPAILLLFNKTRSLGGIISIGVLINVVAINLSFDISVKLFSGILLFLSIFVAWPGIKTIIKVFITEEPFVQEQRKYSPAIFKFRTPIKILLISILFAESFYPHIKRGNLNDDLAERPILHGAYEVVQNSKTALTAEQKRIFFHRDGYIIFQDYQDQMTDFKFDHDPIKQKIVLLIEKSTPLVLNYSKDNNGTLQLHSHDRRTSITLRIIDFKQLPLLQPLFHYTVD